MVFGATGAPLGKGVAYGGDERSTGDQGPGHQRQQDDRKVVPDHVLMLVAIGGEPLQIVLEKEDAEKVGITPLHGNEPGQHHGKVEHGAWPPEGSSQHGPLAAEGCEGKDDQEGEERCDGTLGKRCGADEEVEVEEPELGVGLVPGIPAQHSDAEGRGHLHGG